MSARAHNDAREVKDLDRIIELSHEADELCKILGDDLGAGIKKYNS